MKTTLLILSLTLAVGCQQTGDGNGNPIPPPNPTPIPVPTCPNQGKRLQEVCTTTAEGQMMATGIYWDSQLKIHCGFANIGSINACIPMWNQAGVAAPTLYDSSLCDHQVGLTVGFFQPNPFIPNEPTSYVLDFTRGIIYKYLPLDPATVGEQLYQLDTNNKCWAYSLPPNQHFAYGYQTAIVPLGTFEAAMVTP